MSELNANQTYRWKILHAKLTLLARSDIVLLKNKATQ